MSDRSFTPATGRFDMTRFYDSIIALTRERLWRGHVTRYAAPKPGDVIVDVGCGTGSQAVRLHQAQPQAQIIGIDPDSEVLALARRKADRAGATVQWRVGMGDALAEAVGNGSADTVVSSLVLHQCPMAMKRAILASMFATLKPGGRLVIADFGLQRTWLMRLGFRVVQLADGKEDTQPNADGVLPRLIADAGFQEVREAEVVLTINGSISIYTAHA